MCLSERARNAHQLAKMSKQASSLLDHLGLLLYTLVRLLSLLLRYVECAMGVGARCLEQFAATLIPPAEKNPSWIGKEEGGRAGWEPNVDVVNLHASALRPDTIRNTLQGSLPDEIESPAEGHSLPSSISRLMTTGSGIQDRRKFYAVAVGGRTGIFRSWESYRHFVEGFPYAAHQRFRTGREAEEYLRSFGVDPVYHEK